jgi:hypothetical protein
MRLRDRMHYLIVVDATLQARQSSLAVLGREIKRNSIPFLPTHFL